MVEASKVEGSEKLIQLRVDLGDEVGTRVIYAGIAQWYAPENLIGRTLAFVVNLEAKKFVINGQDLVSEGMMLASGRDEAVLYSFDKAIPPGTIVR